MSEQPKVTDLIRARADDVYERYLAAHAVGADALAALYAEELSFLQALIRDLVREAEADGRARAGAR